MKKMNRDIVILGDGLLGGEIIEQTNWNWISRDQDWIDFNEISWYRKMDKYRTIVNCIACTDTYSPDREKHWQTNYVSVMNLVDYCNFHDKKLIHISTDYIYSNSQNNASEEDIPLHNRTWYAYTKLLSDAYVQARAKNYLIVRTSFKQTPFPYDEAIVTQVGNFDYVNIITELIIKLIKRDACGVFNVGTKKKTICDLAIQTKPEVIAAFWKVNKLMPNNITMNVSKMENFLNES